MILVAAALAVFIGLVHSVLGEKYILVRLFRQPLPKLFGDDDFTKKTLRFAWHITTIAWFGLAGLLALTHFDRLSDDALLLVVGSTFAITALVALVASRGKHLSWVIFGSIAGFCYGSVLLA